MTSFEKCKKTLSNFISKCPLESKINYYVDHSSQVIAVEYKGKVIISIDCNKPVKEQIEYLKNSIYEDYPTLYQIQETKPSVDFLEEKIRKGELTLAQALDYRIETKVEIGKVIRLHHRYNELDVCTHQGFLIKYKCNIPLFAWIRNQKDPSQFIEDKNLLFLREI